MKKWLKALLITAAAATFTVALAACGSNGSTRPANAFVVAFDYNEFDVADGAVSRVRYVGVKADDPYLYVDPSAVVDKDDLVVFDQYYVYSWHLPQGYDDAGEPLRGEDGRVLLKEEAWNLKTDAVTGDMTLYANLVQKPSFTIMDADGTVYRVFYGMPGDVLMYNTVNALSPSKAGHTFYKFYEEYAEGTFSSEYSGSYVYKEGEDKIVYARFLEGEWSIVTSARAFNTAIGANQNIYLDADIDFSSTAFQLGRNYAGTLEGNGHKLTGISGTIRVTKASLDNGTYGGYGLFGVLGATAKIANLTIEDAKLTFAVDSSAYTPTTTEHVGFFAEKAEAGCTLTNVTVSGTLTKGAIAWESDAVDFSPFLGESEGAITENCVYTEVEISE